MQYEVTSSVCVLITVFLQAYKPHNILIFMFSEVCLEQTCLICRKAPPGYEGTVAKEFMECVSVRPCSCALSAAYAFDIFSLYYSNFYMNLTVMWVSRVRNQY